MSTTPENFVLRLAALAEEARHHPQPGVAVSLLAQLLLDVVAELQPLAQRYGLLLRTGGAAAILAELDKHMEAAELQLGATALPGAQAGTYEDLQPDATSTTTTTTADQVNQAGQAQAGDQVQGQGGGAYDPRSDSTGTAG